MIDDELLNDITRLVKEDKRRKKQQQKKQIEKKNREQKNREQLHETPPPAPAPRGLIRFGKLFTKNKNKGGVFTKKNTKEHPPIPTTIIIRHDGYNEEDDEEDNETYSLDANTEHTHTTKLVCLGEPSSPASSSSLIDDDAKSGDGDQNSSSSSFSSGGDSSINSAAQYSSPDEEEEDSNAVTIEIGRTPSAQQDEHADRNNGGEQKHSRITAPSPPQLQPQPKQRISKFKKIFQKKKTKR